MKICSVGPIHQLAHVEESRPVAHPRGLLHVVGDDGDGVRRLQLVDELFSLRGGDEVNALANRPSAAPGGSTAHGAGDTQALLAAGQAQRALW